MQWNTEASPDQKLHSLLSKTHGWQREDVIWIMEYIKQKVTDRDPSLLNLDQSRLLASFQHFAEMAMMLIHHTYRYNQEDQLVKRIKEALYGLGQVEAE